MEFKIDTKPVYTTITPAATTLDANLAAALAAKCHELTETGSAHFIIDLTGCTGADVSSSGTLADLHASCYDRECSLVFTGLQDAVLGALKQEELHHTLHIAPTMAEAVDIIHMEILERDLFKEE